jgi:hypothetical protein
MLRFILFTTFSVLFISAIQGQELGDYRSQSDGDWTVASNWEYYNGTNWNTATTYPGENAGAGDVTINHVITIETDSVAEVYDLIINADGKLIVYGTLIVNNDLIMNSQGNDESEFEMKPNSIVIVKRDVYLTTKVSLNLSSYFIVLRNLDAQSSSENTDININDASIYVFGSLSDKIALDTCDSYDGLTKDNYETCHIGTESAFYNNIDSIPYEIIEIVNPCNASATISGNNDPICSGEDVEFYLSGTTGATVTYNFSGGNNVNVVLTDGSATLSIAGATTSQTLNLVSVNDGSCSQSLSESSAVTVNQFNMMVTDETSTPSGNHCPEFRGPFNANTESYNPGVTEVIFKVEREFSLSSSWAFDFQVDETGEVEVYDLVVSGNNSAINYTGDDAAGSIDATDNTEVTFTFQIWNVPGTTLDVDFMVSNGNDGNCDETGNLTDNNELHTINGMPVVGTFNP